ncbi:Dihydrofolate reductase [Staphylococcus haemolyticus]|uniref:Uncharacterized protein n=1 Tax=Staphylococcus haemolyticus TaxID=1283 RepID=A0A023UFM5_STAHA|nr:hypothetical protein [Staphylococcus sp. HMSC067G10]AHX99872.1 hypothetical protein SHP0163 [Staphylococcus haemolyticus]KKI60175.1 Dihydrofolate reductase [Staphylococcus haemolyticus]
MNFIFIGHIDVLLFYDIADQVQLNLTAVTQYNQFVELSYDVQYE